ncbi:hypothetical protein [Nocardia arthritidis]|uniref:hypothetical protein n=1 Tax=Nocardia arthritidis TaxID=228602 RepID=UPI0007A3C4AB|nr:hypothetical protein [Nocardia arthritidis]
MPISRPSSPGSRKDFGERDICVEGIDKHANDVVRQADDEAQDLRATHWLMLRALVAEGRLSGQQRQRRRGLRG